jgi:hypothetical protein
VVTPSRPIACLVRGEVERDGVSVRAGAERGGSGGGTGSSMDR